jgi:hypothetical protein
LFVALSRIGREFFHSEVGGDNIRNSSGIG